MSLGPCERCYESEALSTFYNGNGTATNLCVHCAVAFIAPLVCQAIIVHGQHLDTVHGDQYSDDDISQAVTLLMVAVAEGNGDLLFVPICSIIDVLNDVQSMMDRTVRSDDIIDKIQNGTISPEDFGTFGGSDSD